MKYYAGIGSRKTPGPILDVMPRLGEALSSKYILRSGGAEGADTVFYLGIPYDRRAEASEIYLPSRKFGLADTTMPGMIDATKLPAWGAALKTVDRYHPTPYRLSPFGRKLMARNAMQVLGANLDNPVSFVACWTPGGELVGGTAQALKIAMDYGIPIRNLGNHETLASTRHWLNTHSGNV